MTVPCLLELVSRGDITPLDVARLLYAGPSAALGLEQPGLVEGQIADLSVIDPQRRWTVSSETLVSRGKNTPFLGRTFTGGATLTLVAGEIVYQATQSEDSR